MNRFGMGVCLLGLLVCRMGVGQTTAPASLPDVVQSLKDYYGDDKKVPAWEQAVQDLSSQQTPVREQAGLYLRTLLVQSLKDEKSGVAPWRATPYWGSSGENPAENLREYIIEAIGKATLADEAVPLLAWYLDEQENPKWAEAAAVALAKIGGPQAGKLLVELAFRPHPNAEVVLAALKQIEGRKLSVAPDRLLALCQSHRQAIRAEAVTIAQALKIGPIPAYSVSAALNAEPLKKLLADMGDLMIELPPTDAKFVVVTTTYVDNAKKSNETATRGVAAGGEGRQRHDLHAVWQAADF